MSHKSSVVSSAIGAGLSVTTLQAIVATVAALHDAGESYRRIGSRLNLLPTDYALLSKIARGESVSELTLRRVGHALGIMPAPRIAVDPCPDCGGVHTGRCHGRVVEVRPVRRRRAITRWADAPVAVLRDALRNREVIA